MFLFQRSTFWQITSYAFIFKQFQLTALSEQKQLPIVKSCLRILPSIFHNNKQPLTTMSLQKEIDLFTYKSGCSSVAFVTTPDMVTARNLSLGLVECKLAACVNIIPGVTSIYMWDNKINEDNEHLMIIKTQTSRLNDLIQYVRNHHPYSVAEVITLPIDKGNDLYLKWLAESVSSKENPMPMQEEKQQTDCDGK